MSARELRATRVVGAARRTWLSLEGQARKPSDYEITTTELLYYPGRGLGVDTPVAHHYREHAAGRPGALTLPRWDSFEDPARTTYTSYVAERRDQEAFLDRSFDAPRTSPDAAEPLLRLVSALRFPLHGLQMLSAYVGALAPGGRIAVIAALQAADELRRIQRLCQWLSRSGRPLAELDAAGRELWQSHAAMQPLRRLIERTLVSYDWSESLIALNGVLKPTLDPLLNAGLLRAAEQSGQALLASCLSSFATDGAWHAAWFEALSRSLRDADAGNGALLDSVRARWLPEALAAASALSSLLPHSPERNVRSDAT